MLGWVVRRDGQVVLGAQGGELAGESLEDGVLGGQVQGSGFGEGRERRGYPRQGGVVRFDFEVGGAAAD